jgi:hypothetical protein
MAVASEKDYWLRANPFVSQSTVEVGIWAQVPECPEQLLCRGTETGTSKETRWTYLSSVLC